MRRLVEILFGVDPAPWTEGGQWRLEWLALPRHGWALFAVIAVAVAAVGVLWLYRREGRNLSLPVRLSLTALRMTVLLGVLAMLLEPVLVFSKREYVPSNLIVLLDRSASMDLRDAYVDEEKATRIAESLRLSGRADELRERTRLELAQRLLEGGLADALALGGHRQVKVVGFTSQLLPEEKINSTTQPSTPPDATTRPNTDADRGTTAIGTAIRQAIAAYRGRPLAGVLVISDGQSNGGEPTIKAAEFAAAEGVPVVAVAAGTAEGPRNAKLTKLEASPVAFVRDPNAVRVLIESQGMTKAEAEVVLEKSRDGGPWEEVGRQPVVLEEAGRVQTAEFEVKEDRPTKLELRARLEGVGSELTDTDNLATGEMRVIRQKIRVLFVAGSTFPEVEFVRNALLRDTGLSASTWLQTADAKYEQFGNPPVKRLPVTQEEMNEFDCVVLYDPDPALWPDNFPQLLTDFVAKAGGGLVYVAGERMTGKLFERQDDPTLDWLGMLPVVVEPGLYRSEVQMRLSAREPWRLDITSEGRADPIFQFNTTPQKNEAILANLPGMFWHYPVSRAKPGATVLARHGDPRMRNEYGPHVLLATQLVGPGRTFFVGFDSTYRWRYLDEHYFDGFWARMIDRAGRNKQLGGRYPYTLSTDRASYRPGTLVTLTARFENAADVDAGLESLHGELEAPGDSSAITLTLNPRPGEPGVFETTFPVERPGPHFIRVWSGEPDLKAVAKAATLPLSVELPNVEWERPGLEAATLYQLAGATGGQVFDMGQGASIPAAFKVAQVARTLEDRQEVWNAPILFGVILLALFGEWVLRKKFRMV